MSTLQLVHLYVSHVQESCKSKLETNSGCANTSIVFLALIYRRGLTPPHRVKSISMASFTPEEIEFLKSRGNEVIILKEVVSLEIQLISLRFLQYCRLVWMGHYNLSNLPGETKEEQRFKDHLVAKYERKR